MITFGQKIKLTSNRKTPDQYDLIWWGPMNAFNHISVDFTNYASDDTISPPYNCGYEYHIMVYPKYFNNKSDDICIDMSRACLIDPLDYCETLVWQYYGVIGKVSANSYNLFQDLKENLKEDGNLIDLFNMRKEKTSWLSRVMNRGMDRLLGLG